MTICGNKYGSKIFGRKGNSVKALDESHPESSVTRFAETLVEELPLLSIPSIHNPASPSCTERRTHHG
jgi:hypothetical protein